MNLDTRMFREAAAAPAAVRRQLSANRDLVEQLGEALREWRRAPSSPARAAAPTTPRRSRSTWSRRARACSPLPRRLRSARCTRRRRISKASCSSRSRSPGAARTCSLPRGQPGTRRTRGRARQREDSPLARAAHHVIPLRAGVESSVAATKSYIASLAAIVQLVAAGRRTTNCKRRWIGVPISWRARGSSTGAPRSSTSDRPAVSTSSAAGSVSVSRRRPRSSSRKPADCTPRLQRRGGAPRSDGAGAAGISGARFRAA